MPSVQSKSVHEIKLNGGDLKRLQNGQSIEVDVGDSIIRLKSTAEDFAEDDTDLEDLASVKEQADEEAEDKGDIVPEKLRRTGYRGKLSGEKDDSGRGTEAVHERRSENRERRGESERNGKERMTLWQRIFGR